MTTIPLVSMNPTGITFSCRSRDLLLLSRATILELYFVKENQLLLVQQVNINALVCQIYVFQKKDFLIVTAQNVLVLSRTTLATLKTFNLYCPGSVQFSQPLKPISAFSSQENLLLVGVSDSGISYNFLNLIDFSSDNQQVHRFSAGQLISIAAYGNQFALLVKSQPSDPSMTLSSFQALRCAYLQIFTCKQSNLVESQKQTQIPSDAYAVTSAFDGFLVLCPRQFIFKRNQLGDLRFRFCTLKEEKEENQQKYKELFDYVFKEQIDFDFSNLFSKKIVNQLVNNVQLENDQIYTIEQNQLPLAPKSLLPGHPVPDLYDYFKFYGYNEEEISMKMNQIAPIIGNFPVCDFMLEAELLRYKDNNVNFMGILSQVQNFVEIAPLYGCTFAQLNDEFGLIIDENGLFYTIQVENEDIKMLPIIFADKDLAIRTDNRFQSAQCLFEGKSVNNLFSGGQDGERIEFQLFLGSYTQDSYICKLQICKDVPNDTYYTDYRQHQNVSSENIKEQILNEIKKNCAIINKQQEQLAEKEDNDIEEIGVGYFKTKISKKIAGKLFPTQLIEPFQGINLFDIDASQYQKRLEDVDHGVLQFKTIVPSLSGVLDSFVQPISPENQDSSLFILNNTGIIQRVQQKITFRKAQMIKNVGERVRCVFLLYQQQIENYEEYVVLLTTRQGNDILRIFQADGAYTSEKLASYQFLKNCIVLDCYFDGKLTYVATLSELIQVNMATGAKSVISLGQDEMFTQACFCGQALVAVNETTLKLIKFPGEKQSYEIEELLQYFQLDYNTAISAAFLNEFPAEQLQSVLNIKKQSAKTAVLLTVTFVNSLVMIFQLCDGQLIPVLFWHPLLLGKETYSIATRSNIMQSYDDYNPLGHFDHKFFSQAMPFLSTSAAGSILYFAVSTRAGFVALYQYNQLAEQFCALELNDVQPLSPAPEGHYDQTNYWATFCTHKDKTVNILQQKPFQAIKIQQLGCLLINYPVPCKTTIPNSKICVPGLQSALSVFQIGTNPQSIRVDNNSYYLESAVPPRCSFQTLNGQLIGLFDTRSLYNGKDVKTTETCSLGIYQLEFGKVYSSLQNLPFQRLNKYNYIQYSASLGQNSYNLRRNLILLPFQADKFTYNSKTASVIVVGAVNRREIRPPRSMTKDEVANIRIFEIVQDEQDKKVQNDEILKNCHSLIQRNPPPCNSFNTFRHQHLFLLSRNQIVDSLQLEMQRAEHVNDLQSDLLYSNYPSRFGRYWQGSNVLMDAYGRMDRRNKNDDQQKRQQALDVLHQQTKNEQREMLVVGTNYCLGSFQKCYGRILVVAVENVNDQTQRQDQEIYANSIHEVEENFRNRALRQNINSNFFILRQSRFPFGQKQLQMNQIAFSELQNAVTACCCAPNCRSLLVAEAKQLKTYELIDSQKLQLNGQYLGMGHVTRISRFQDFYLVSDGMNESRLFVFKSAGKRISEMCIMSRDVGLARGEFMINQYTKQLYSVFAHNAQQLCVYSYRFAEKKDKREKFQLVQQFDTHQHITSISKCISVVPLPTDQKLQSGIISLVSTLEGGILQMVPVPPEICSICGFQKEIIKTDGWLNPFDLIEIQGGVVTFNYEDTVTGDIQQMIQAKTRLFAGGW